MPKTKITDYSASQASNTDIGGVNIAENCQFGNVNDAIRYLAAHLANMNAGTDPLADTVTFGDPADLTKRFRLDAGSITASATRVIAVPDTSGTMVLASGAQALQSKTFADASDATKILAFALSGITTGTTRTVTWPDANGTVMLGSQYPTAVSLEGLSLVAGDILYASGADTLVRLPKGADGQILELVSGVPAWVDSPRLTLIASLTGVGGTTIPIVDLGAYNRVELIFEAVGFSASTQPSIRLSTNNGASYAGTDYVGAASNDATGTGSTAEAFLTDGPTTNAISGKIVLDLFNDASQRTSINGLIRGDTATNTAGNKVIFQRDVAEANNAIQFATSGATITGGTIRVLGCKR